MKFEEFHRSFPVPVFTAAQSGQTLIQLSRWVKGGKLMRLKRGIYQFSDRLVDEFALAGYLYMPSYVSLETALNNFGIIPDVSAAVTSVSPTTTKVIQTVRGNYYYAKIQAGLFWGWESVSDSHKIPYKIALPEKALLDWIYLRKISDLSAYRVSLADLNRTGLIKFARQFPVWVRKVVDEQLNR